MMQKFKDLPSWKWVLVVIVVAGTLSMVWHFVGGNGA